MVSRPDGWYCWGDTKGGDLVEYLAWRRHGARARDLDARAWTDIRAALSGLGATGSARRAS